VAGRRTLNSSTHIQLPLTIYSLSSC